MSNDVDQNGDGFQESELSRATSDVFSPLPPSEANTPIEPYQPLEVETPPPGKDPRTGQFLKGHRYSRGLKTISHQAAVIRRALYAAVGPEEMTEMVAAIVAKAKRGDVAAFKIIAEYTLGPPQPLDIIQGIVKLQDAILRGAISNE